VVVVGVVVGRVVVGGEVVVLEVVIVVEAVEMGAPPHALMTCHSPSNAE
jgi:hypothetical protein